jgi:hypothetical protein
MYIIPADTRHKQEINKVFLRLMSTVGIHNIIHLRSIKRLTICMPRMRDASFQNTGPSGPCPMHQTFRNIGVCHFPTTDVKIYSWLFRQK